MSISDTDYKNALSKIRRYFERPDPDGYQRLRGSELRNTIGFALSNLPITLPETDDELARAADNDFCFFTGDCLKAIEVIEIKLYEVADTKEFVDVCVIPTVLAYDGNLYDLPTFRLHGAVFIDNCGRYYSDWDNWKNSNKLPPGIVVYPNGGSLQSDTSNTELPFCSYALTPAGTTGAKVIKGMDVAATLTGVGIGVAGFFTGGVALLGAAIGTSIYGLIRSGTEIVDRGTHKESLNPFTDSRARMVWLGVAANVVGFGAMGSSMRLAFVAGKGKVISDTLKVVVDSLNAASLVTHSPRLLSGYADLLSHLDNLSDEEVVFTFLQTTFFVKGVFTYRTAGQIISEARQGYFNGVTRSFNEEELQQFNAARSLFKCDTELIHFMKSPNAVSPEFAAKLLCELHTNNAVFRVDDQGRITLGPGSVTHMVDARYLADYPPDVRAAMFNVLGSSWETPEWHAFDNLRTQVNGDPGLFRFIGQISKEYDVNPRDAARGLSRIYSNAGTSAGQLMPRIEGEYLLVAKGHSFTPQQLYKYLPSHFDVINQHLVPMTVSQTTIFNQFRVEFNDDLALFNWMSILAVPIGYKIAELLTTIHTEGLLQLKLKFADANILIHDQLRVSLHRLNQIGSPNRMRIVDAFNRYANGFHCLEATIPRELSFKYEHERQLAVDWFNGLPENSLTNRKYVPHEMDSLIGLNVNFNKFIQKFNDTTLCTAILRWSFTDAANVSEFAVHIEYCMVRLMKANSIDVETFCNTGRIDGVTPTALFNKAIDFVNSNQMVGILTVAANLSDSVLISTLQSSYDRIRFGSSKSAAYHINKHQMKPAEQYLTMAQDTIRYADPGLIVVKWAQDGTSRNIAFEGIDNNGYRSRAFVLEDQGRVLLRTYWKQTLSKAERSRGGR